MSDREGKKRGLLGRLFGGQNATEGKVEDAAAETPVRAPDIAPAMAPPPDLADAAPLELPPAAQGPTASETPPKKQGWLSRLTTGLQKTSTQLTQGIASVFTKRRLDAATLEDLEDLLIQADLGPEMAQKITGRLKKDRFDKDISTDDVRDVLAGEVAAVLRPLAKPLLADRTRRPHVMLMVGVNGTGKTTTIGKLAAKFRKDGLKVMIAAGDTFRAAAVDQLRIWAERTGATMVARDVGADSAGLAFEALEAARKEHYDVLLIDTAGRLQNKSVLMEELEKIVRVMRKIDPEAPHDVVLVLDATTGQNAANQVDVFRQRAGVTGLVMTKLDGTARGGILVAIAAKHALPLHAIGVGESVDDLLPFDADSFAKAIAGDQSAVIA